MTTVAVAPISTKAPAQASTPKQGTHDGFARELEAAARADARAKARKDHDHTAPTRNAHDAAVRPRANEARDAQAATGAGEAANKDADDKATSDDLATTDDKATATDGATQAATASGAAATTDSTGPGTSSSGEASLDPAAPPVLAAAATAAAVQEGALTGADETGTDSQAASPAQSVATSTNHAGATSSRSVGPVAVEATGTTTPEPATSGEVVAGPVAVGGASSQGAAGHETTEQGAGSGTQDKTAAKAKADAAVAPGATTPAPAGQATESPDAPVAAAQAPAQATATQAPTMTPTSGVAPLDAGAQAAAPTAVTQASASQPALPVPLSTQLTGQLTSIRQLPQGEHVLTLTVNPETFGPVKVVAHITHDGVSLQLFGASDQARAALKAALPDLRRDLAGVGLEPHLELDSGSGSGFEGRGAMGDPSSFARQDGSTRRAQRGTPAGVSSVSAPALTPTTHATRRGGIDLVL